MSLSTQTAVSDGTLASLGVSLDFIDRSTITVYFEGVPTPSTTGLWSWVGSTSKTINFTPAVPFGVQVTIKRTTDISAPVHRFSEGAQFRSDTLDESILQILHAAQEFAEINGTPSDAVPLPVVADASLATPGISSEYARADHVHSGGGGSGGGSGGSGLDGYSSALVYAYQRAATAPALTPGGVTYSFTSHAITLPAGNTLANGWTKLIPAGNDPLYVTVATASSNATGDVVASTDWSAPVVLVKDGLAALNVATVYAYARTPTNAAPAAPSATATFTFSNGALTGLNNGWTQAIPPSYGGPYLWVLTATASSLTNSDTIAAGEWAVGLMAKDGTDGLNGGSNGLSNASFYAYKRSLTAPVDNPGDVTYHFPSASITTPSTDALANGWTKAVPAGSNPLYVTVASASGATATDNVLAAEWTTPSLMGGGAAMNIATLYIYQRTTGAAPTGPTGAVTYTFATSAITGLTNGWSAALPSAGGAYLWVTTATAAGFTATDSIPTTEWATPQKLAQDGANGSTGSPGSNGSNGTRGTVQLVTSGSSWSNATANAAISSAGYGGPINRDIVTIANGSSYAETRYYDYGSWVNLTAYIDGNMLVTGTLSANKITGGTLNGVQVNFGTGHTVSGKAFEITSTGVVWVDNIVGGVIWGDNYNYDSEGVYGVSSNNRAYCGVHGLVAASNANMQAHGVRGNNYYTGTSGIVGCANTFDFYADGSGTNYGPFTGAHDVLLAKNLDIALGDIVIDVKCVGRNGLSNTIFEVAPSTRECEPAAVGVLVVRNGALVDAYVPAAFSTAEMVDDKRIDGVTDEYVQNRYLYDIGAANALGEGQMNVCGRNGDLVAGDFICSSSLRGKGQKQSSAMLMNYTVAKARESVTFSHPDEVKLVPCIYVCG